MCRGMLRAVSVRLGTATAQTATVVQRPAITPEWQSSTICELSLKAVGKLCNNLARATQCATAVAPGEINRSCSLPFPRPTFLNAASVSTRGIASLVPRRACSMVMISSRRYRRPPSCSTKRGYQKRTKTATDEALSSIFFCDAKSGKELLHAATKANFQSETTE